MCVCVCVSPFCACVRTAGERSCHVMISQTLSVYSVRSKSCRLLSIFIMTVMRKT